MTTEQMEDLRRDAIIRERMSRFVRSRILALELGVQIVAMDFSTGQAILHFNPEDAPKLAALAGAA